MTKQIAIYEVIPHRPPMLMMDEVVTAGDDNAHVRCVIRENHVFYDPALGGVPTWIGIEIMAQTIAAGAGELARRKNEPAPIGFLLGTRDYQAEVDVFPLHMPLDVYALQEMESSGMTVFRCRIESQDRLLASSLLNVYRAPAGTLDRVRQKGGL